MPVEASEQDAITELRGANAEIDMLRAENKRLRELGDRLAEELLEWAVMEPEPSAVGQSNAAAVAAWRGQ